MDTLDFLKAVLPGDGTVYFLALIRTTGGGAAHIPYSSLEDLAAGVTKHSQNPGVNVYHACASYHNPFVMQPDPKNPGQQKKAYRVLENQDRAKAFWVDIDCGADKAAEGKGYPLRSEAVAALYGFADEVAIPRPMIVNSGGGVHAYWPLDRAIGKDKWQPVADTLKACLAHYGVIADPTRTADFASILRPVGSANRKFDPPKAVRTLIEVPAIHPKDIAVALAAYKQANDVKVFQAKVAPTVVTGPNADLVGLLDQVYPQQDTSGELCAENGCLQMQAMRDTRGDVSYPHWFNVIGVLKHCVDGEELAEHWSELREITGHTQVDWRHKWDTWNAGPTTCQRFESDNPQGCMGCVHRGNIVTPMQIGRVVPEAKTEMVVDEGGAEEEVDLPPGYKWDTGTKRMVYHQRMADGTVEVKRFSTHLLWVDSRVYEDNTFHMKIKAKLADGRIREFSVQQETVAAPADLAKALAKRGEVYVTSDENQHAGKIMAAYLKEQLMRLQARTQEQSTHKTFGWQPDGSFLIGDRLYLKDGGVRQVITGGNAMALQARMFPAPRGTLAGYVAPINRIYNRSGLEWAQYAICSGLGSILSPLTGEELYKGVLVALQGGSTGKGKTTACQASLFAFGDASQMTIGGKDGFTVNGLWGTVAALNNIPLLVDELTNIDPKDFSNLAYGICNGMEKVRSHSGSMGVVLADRAQWSVSPFITGNTDFMGLLAAHQSNSQAEAVRVVQLNVDSYPDVLLDEDPGKATLMIRTAVREMRDNMGAAGDVLLRFVVAHQDSLRAELEREIDILAQDLPGTKYRYYRCHIACSLVAGRLASTMGFEFDLDCLREFAIKAMTDLAESVAESNTMTAETAFARMMSEFTPRVLNTASMLDARKGTVEAVKLPPRGEIWARFVADKALLYVESSRAREWCANNRISFKAMVVELEAKGALLSKTEKVVLTKGTDLGHMGQTVCLVIDMKRVIGVLASVGGVANSPASVVVSAASPR